MSAAHCSLAPAALMNTTSSPSSLAIPDRNLQFARGETFSGERCRRFLELQRAFHGHRIAPTCSRAGGTRNDFASCLFGLPARWCGLVSRNPECFGACPIEDSKSLVLFRLDTWHHLTGGQCRPSTYAATVAPRTRGGQPPLPDRRGVKAPRWCVGMDAPCIVWCNTLEPCSRARSLLPSTCPWSRRTAVGHHQRSGEPL